MLRFQKRIAYGYMHCLCSIQFSLFAMFLSLNIVLDCSIESTVLSLLLDQILV